MDLVYDYRLSKRDWRDNFILNFVLDSMHFTLTYFWDGNKDLKRHNAKIKKKKIWYISIKNHLLKLDNYASRSMIIHA